MNCADLDALGDQARRQIVLFGGDTRSTGALGDTWFYDGTRWRQAATNGPPPARALPWSTTRAAIVSFSSAATTKGACSAIRGSGTETTGRKSRAMGRRRGRSSAWRSTPHAAALCSSAVPAGWSQTRRVMATHGSGTACVGRPSTLPVRARAITWRWITTPCGNASCSMAEARATPYRVRRGRSTECRGAVRQPRANTPLRAARLR